ncbi:serine/threonine-protein kinase [Streptomyces wedmorensis]
MGTVWRAHDVVLDRDVAVKELSVGELPADELAVLQSRMEQEARAAARIKHPGVVTVYDVLEQDGRPWIVMELIDGRALADVIASDGPLPPRDAARVGAQVLSALEQAHKMGVVHRDVKPANVLLEQGGRVVLSDFGIAAFEGSTRYTRDGDVVGSPDYLAPEQISGDGPGPASDLWSLGATLYTAVEGRSPFSRPSAVSTLHAVVADPLPEPRRAGPLGPVIEALLRKDPHARPTADQARRVLAAVASGSVLGTPLRAAEPHPPTQLSAAGPGPAPSAAAERAYMPTESTPSTPVRPYTGGESPTVPTTPADGGHKRRTVLLVTVALLVLLLSGGGLGVALYNNGQDKTAQPPVGTTQPMQPPTQPPASPTQPPQTTQPPPTPQPPQTTPAQPPTTPARPPQTTPAQPPQTTPAQPPTTPAQPPQTTPAQPPTTPARPPQTTPAQPPQTTPAQPPTTPAQPPATPAPPAGYQWASDPAGFRVAVPQGWTRSVTSGQINYSPDGGTHLLRFAVNPNAPQNSLDHFLGLEQTVGNFRDYRRLVLRANTYQGYPGALWEFSWNAEQFGPRHAIDQSFVTPDGTEYLIYVGYPEGEWAAGRQVFDTALSTYSLT